MALSSSPSLLALLAILWGAEPALSNRRTLDRRVVDRVQLGEARSEAAHGYAGHDVVAGVAGGTSFRQARGWMRYALTTFDDTEVTVACTFVRTEGLIGPYDVVVEDSVIATRTHSSSTASSVVEIRVPFSITKGRTNIAIMIRARGGLTPALSELRTVQDHNEDVTSSRSQNSSGAVR